MPDSGTSAMDTYAYDPVAKEWRHSPNGLLHYAEHGTQTIFRPDPPNVTAPALSTTFLLYVQRIDGRMETTRRCCRIRSMTHHYDSSLCCRIRSISQKREKGGHCWGVPPPYSPLFLAEGVEHHFISLLPFLFRARARALSRLRSSIYYPMCTMLTTVRHPDGITHTHMWQVPAVTQCTRVHHCCSRSTVHCVRW